jgi:hypothetical protein
MSTIPDPFKPIQDAIDKSDINTARDLINIFLSSSVPVPTSSKSSEWLNIEQGAPEYFRNDKLELVDSKNKQVKPEVTKDICKSVGSKSTNEKECAEYIQKCLLGQNIEDCKKYLKDQTFWSTSAVEVRNMNPELAKKTLDALKWPYSTTTDSMGRSITVAPSAGTWAEKVLKTEIKDSTELNAIVRNTELMSYLNLLVEKINLSPAVLNPNSSASKMPKAATTPNSGIQSLNILPSKKSYLRPSSVVKLGQTIVDNNRSLSISLGYPGLVGYTHLMKLSGGSKDLITELEDNISGKVRPTWKILSDQYETFKLRMKAMNKTIQKDDEEKISNMIEDLKQKEMKMFRAILITEKYTHLLQRFGQRDDVPELNFDHLKEFVEKRNHLFSRVQRRQATLIDVIKAIAESLQK